MNSPLSDAQMREALQRAFNLGREYFPLAMSEYDSARERSAEVLTAFKNMVEDTSSAFLAGSAEPAGAEVMTLEWAVKLAYNAKAAGGHMTPTGTVLLAEAVLRLDRAFAELIATPIPADSDRSGAPISEDRIDAAAAFWTDDECFRQGVYWAETKHGIRGEGE